MHHITLQVKSGLCPLCLWTSDPLQGILNVFLAQLVACWTSNPKVPGLIRARDNQNLLKKISRVGGFSFMVIWNPWVLYIKDLIVFCFGNDFVFKSIAAPCDSKVLFPCECTIWNWNFRDMHLKYVQKTDLFNILINFNSTGRAIWIREYKREFLSNPATLFKAVKVAWTPAPQELWYIPGKFLPYLLNCSS